MKSFFENLFFADSPAFRLVRITTVAGSVTAVVGAIDRYFPNRLPTGYIGIILFVLTVACGVLVLELLNAHKDIRTARAAPLVGDARTAFAASLVAYAASLAASTPPRDKALLELRRWTSRLLHLNCSHKERAEIGRLALGAAAALHDKFTEASILIDDLGWGIYVQGLGLDAEQGVKEGIALIEEMPESERSRSEVVELLLKARRHLLSIRFASHHNINTALHDVEELSKATSSLPEPSRSLHLAQLGHTEAALIHKHLDTALGPQGQVDPTGRLNELFQRALDRSRAAEASFCELGDIERQLKALKIHVELLRHGSPATRLHAAEARLKRLETVASRHLN